VDDEFLTYVIAFVVLAVAVVGGLAFLLLNCETNSNVVYITGEVIVSSQSEGKVKIAAMELYYKEWVKTWYKVEINHMLSPGFYLISANGFKTVKSAEKLSPADLDLLGINSITIY
jgi:hypothetical protein